MSGLRQRYDLGGGLTMRWLVAAAGMLLASVSASATNYTVTVPDDSGVAYARTQYNTALPKDAKTGLPIGALATDQDYIQFLMGQAAASWATQMKVAPLDAAKAKCMAGDCTDAAKVK